MAAGFASQAWITWLAATILATCTYVLAEEECLNSRIQCYDCDSEQEPRCHDPFNHTEENRPIVKECKGCCVKIVSNHGRRQSPCSRAAADDSRQPLKALG
ncbi:UPAR/Ly6 domain-containing protein qvr-like isoform X2 [Ornithodoros turicata]|uniref:UPAR/Ly6 domain-containing protein qvr-like isoform X2 n=1 Tax=Ornithodoros turicata TaxID=34597 RepID=UPI00313A0ACB